MAQTTITQPPVATSRPAAAAASAEPRLRQRRPIHWFYLGILVLALGGIAGGWYLGRGGATRTAVIVSTKITAGQKITADQLTTTQLPLNSDIASIPDSRLCDPKTKPSCSDGLIGMYAQATLSHGAVLTADQVTATLTPPTGHSVIGVALKPSQMPARGLSHGDTVRLVLTVSASGVAAQGAQQPGTSWPGTVVTSGPAGANGVVTVDVQVSSDVATAVAAASGGGNIAAVLDPPAAS